jgi:hypothetical protein
MTRIFWGLLHKSVPREFLTLPFDRFWLRIRGDIRNQQDFLTDEGSFLLNIR